LKRRDFIIGLAMALIAALVIFVLIPQGVAEPKKVKFAALSPSYYPRIVAIALLLIGAAVSVRALIANTADEAPDVERHPQAMQRFLLIFVIIAICALSIGWLGFIVASSLVLLATMLLAGERRFQVIIPIAILVPVGLYFFFLKVAGIPIPMGVLEPWLVGV